ncbi:MAG: Magnesium transporter MgtE [Phycisphaerae bacterium]|nr:Magnesium transporter MgtE [Phycisphaerae bacterium]
MNEPEKMLSLLQSALSTDPVQTLPVEIQELEPADLAELMQQLDEEQRSCLLYQLDSPTAAAVFIELTERLRDELVEELPPQQLAEYLTELSPDDAVDVVQALSPEESDAVLRELPEQQSAEIGRLLKYSPNTAGGLMNSRVLALKQQCTVAEARASIAETTLPDAEAFGIYTVDAEWQLTGVVPPRRLLVAAADRRLQELHIPQPVYATVHQDQEEVVQIFRKYDLTTLPVIDSSGRLVGQITVDDVMDVADAEAEKEIFRMAGTDPTEQETTSILQVSWIRLAWLLPSFLFLSGSATVITISTGWFTDPARYAALVAFLPMIGALAGCCSVQAATVIIRGMATGETAARRVALAFAREGRIALVMAPACAVIAWGIARAAMPALQRIGRVAENVEASEIAWAVGNGMLVAILVASGLGIVTPFIFRRLGIDPAIAAGPIVTAANDVICITIYLTLAYGLLP